MINPNTKVVPIDHGWANQNKANAFRTFMVVCWVFFW